MPLFYSLFSGYDIACVASVPCTNEELFPRSKSFFLHFGRAKIGARTKKSVGGEGGVRLRKKLFVRTGTLATQASYDKVQLKGMPLNKGITTIEFYC